jgi:hypothetical protein
MLSGVKRFLSPLRGRSMAQKRRPMPMGSGVVPSLCSYACRPLHGAADTWFFRRSGSQRCSRSSEAGGRHEQHLPNKGASVPATRHNPIVCAGSGRCKRKAGGVRVKVKVKGFGISECRMLIGNRCWLRYRQWQPTPRLTDATRAGGGSGEGEAPAEPRR